MFDMLSWQTLVGACTSVMNLIHYGQIKYAINYTLLWVCLTYDQLKEKFNAYKA